MVTDNQIKLCFRSGQVRWTLLTIGGWIWCGGTGGWGRYWVNTGSNSRHILFQTFPLWPTNRQSVVFIYFWTKWRKPKPICCHIWWISIIHHKMHLVSWGRLERRLDRGYRLAFWWYIMKSHHIWLPVEFYNVKTNALYIVNQITRMPVEALRLKRWNMSVVFR